MPCDCDQSYDMHPPGYHDIECSIWGQPYVWNVFTMTGRSLPIHVQTPQGMALWQSQVLDQRDDFELGFLSCASVEPNASQAPPPST